MLNQRQVEAFRAVFETGTVTGASRLLNVSQPSVTRLIGDLEEDVGFRLFVRQRRGMVPTSEALLFYQQVERSFLGLRELEAAADEIRGHGRHRLVLGLTPAVALEFAPRIIADFSRSHDDVQIETRVSTSDRILDQVRSARLSLAIMSSDEAPSDVTILRERRFAYVALMHCDHGLAADPGILDIAEHPDLRLIGPPASFLVANCDDSHYAERFIAASVIEVEVHVTAAALARHGMGVALVDPFTAMFFAADETLVTRPLAGAPQFPFRLIEPRRLHASSLQRELVASVIERLDMWP